MEFNKKKFMDFVKEEPISLIKPMNMILSEGCTADELAINGIQEINMTDTQRKVVIHKIMNWYKKNPDKLNNLLQYFIEAHAEDYDISKPCEQCGDCICTYRMTI